jgi:nucleotide-binding universal stress UspA family protein
MEPTRTILHPTDFSEPARHAFRLACSLARDQGARLLVLHVAPPSVEGVPRADDYFEGLSNDLRQLQDEEPRARLEHLLREGDPATEIPRVAQELHCDLIVMATHGWVRGERLLMGSVAHAVFSRAPCLLVVVRPPFPDVPASAGTPAQEPPEGT